MSITAFPKIFALGTDYISRIFENDVEITEKIDGSQFIFGKVDGELVVRSKGRIIHDYLALAETDLFYPVVRHVTNIQNRIPDNMAFYGETLCKPKHNTLQYERVPKNNFMLFGVSTLGHKFESDYETLSYWADHLSVEVVPLLYRGHIDNAEQILDFMNKESVLGGTNAEGVVVKNYVTQFLLGGVPIPVMAGKYVTEAFKEVHRKNWTKENTGVGKWQEFKNGYRTEARWDKAIQHLAENNELEWQPRDIGKLIPEIARDIKEEEMDIIKDFLWRQFGQEVIRYAQSGFPEYYKQKLLERGFTDA